MLGLKTNWERKKWILSSYTKAYMCRYDLNPAQTNVQTNGMLRTVKKFRNHPKI
jgi:hypothetical protein